MDTAVASKALGDLVEVASSFGRQQLVTAIQEFCKGDEALAGLSAAAAAAVANGAADSEASLRDVVNEKLAFLPFGLRAHAVRLLAARKDEWQKRAAVQEVSPPKPLSLGGGDDGGGGALLKTWQHGAATPSELFAAVERCTLADDTSSALVAHALALGGYRPEHHGQRDGFDRTRRFRADCRGFDLAALDHRLLPSPDGAGLDLLAARGTQAARVAADLRAVRALPYPSSCHLPTASARLLWRYEHARSGLLAVPVPSQGRRPLLVVGGTLSLPSGVLDIDAVVGVDVCPAADPRGWTASSSRRGHGRRGSGAGVGYERPTGSMWAWVDGLHAVALVGGTWRGGMDRSSKGRCARTPYLSRPLSRPI